MKRRHWFKSQLMKYIYGGLERGKERGEKEKVWEGGRERERGRILASVSVICRCSWQACYILDSVSSVPFLWQLVNRISKNQTQLKGTEESHSSQLGGSWRRQLCQLLSVFKKMRVLLLTESSWNLSSMTMRANFF